MLEQQQPVRHNGFNGSEVGQVRSAAVQQTAQSGDNCLVSMNARKHTVVTVDDKSNQCVNSGLDVSKSQLTQLQMNHATLVELYGLAKGIRDLNGSSQCVLRDGVLMRLWCDRHSASDWCALQEALYKCTDTIQYNRPSDMPIKQIVVPLSLRQQLISVAHDELPSAHLGVKKTLDRLQRHFFWPGINSDVRKYCASCVICQRLAKSGEHVRVPLINLLVIDEVWRKIAVDVVGPLECCKVTGCRFLVTIIDLASHFPLVYPVWEHMAAEVAKCLINAFSLFGFPCEILFDQGTEFLSEIMKVFL